MKTWFIKHLNILALLYFKTPFLHKYLAAIIQEQRKKGLLLAKNITGRTIKRNEFVTLKSTEAGKDTDI